MSVPTPSILIAVDQSIPVSDTRAEGLLVDAGYVIETTSFDRREGVYVLNGALVASGYAMRANANTDGPPQDADGDVFTDFRAEGDAFPGYAPVNIRVPFVLEVPEAAQSDIVSVRPRVEQGATLSFPNPENAFLSATVVIEGLSDEQGYRLTVGEQDYGPGITHVETESLESQAAFARSTEGNDEKATEWGEELVRADRALDGDDASRAPEARQETFHFESYASDVNDQKAPTDPAPPSAQWSEAASDASDGASEGEWSLPPLEGSGAEGSTGDTWQSPASKGTPHLEIQAAASDAPRAAEDEDRNDVFYPPVGFDAAGGPVNVNIPAGEAESSAESLAESGVFGSAPSASLGEASVDPVLVAPPLEEEVTEWSETDTLSVEVDVDDLSDAALDAAAVVHTKSGPAENQPASTVAWLQTLYTDQGATTKYTMRFRIVQYGESLEDIASQYRVLTSDLQAANRLTGEELEPGSAIYVPARHSMTVV